MSKATTHRTDKQAPTMQQQYLKAVTKGGRHGASVAHLMKAMDLSSRQVSQIAVVLRMKGLADIKRSPDDKERPARLYHAKFYPEDGPQPKGSGLDSTKRALDIITQRLNDAGPKGIAAPLLHKGLSAFQICFAFRELHAANSLYKIGAKISRKIPAHYFLREDWRDAAKTTPPPRVRPKRVGAVTVRRDRDEWTPKPKAVREAIITAQTRHTVLPSGRDFRYTVTRLPEGYESALDASAARPWAMAVAS